MKGCLVKHSYRIKRRNHSAAQPWFQLRKIVQAPRIAECLVNLECRLEWHRPLYEGNRWHLMAGRVVHVAMDESIVVTDPAERMQAMRLFYNIRGTVNPLDGQQYGPNSLGLLNEVVKTFDEGQPEE